MNNSIFKSFLSFFWLLPFLYILLNSLVEIDNQFTDEVLKSLFFISFLCAFTLLMIWLRELQKYLNKKKVFEAIKNNNVEILQHLIRGSYIEPQSYLKEGRSLLKYAIDEKVDPEIILVLVENNCYSIIDQFFTNSHISYSLFYLCAHYNNMNTSIIKFFLSKGADINFRDDTKGFDGLSILQTLVLRCNKSMITLVLEEGADIDYIIEELSLNALMLAAKYVNDPNIIQLLLQYGANLEVKNNNGYNALLLAAQYNPHPSIIKTIVQSGAELKIYRIYSSLLKYNEVTALILASTYNNNSVVKTLIELGDNVEFKDRLGLNSLFLASAHNSSIEVIKTLLSAASLSLENTHDADGNTPLMAASFLNSNPMVIKYLLSNTHDIRALNNDGFHFLDYLKQNKYISDKEKNNILRISI